MSSSSVYPESTEVAFELAGSLGYDGVEIMVGVDSASSNVSRLSAISQASGVPVRSIHAPCLLVTATVWSTDPVAKLEKSVEAAGQLGAEVVVVHPPFRWQRPYAGKFLETIAELQASSGVTMAVENMYPWRGPFGIDLRAYSPGWDPAAFDWDHLTLDFSHASTSRRYAADLVEEWGDRLAHVHLCDGRGFPSDDHLPPGKGDQRADEALQRLARRGYSGQVVVEINSRRAANPAARRELLGECLAFARTHLGQSESSAESS